MTKAVAADLTGFEESAASRAAPMLIHVGFHKTGSTWLQSNLFNNAGLGFETINDAPRHRIVDDFVVPDPLFFDARSTAAHYARYIEQAKESGLTLALSHERLSGYAASGGYDRTLIAQRLRATFDDCRVLIVLREQTSLIGSMYSQYVTDGGGTSLRRFLNAPGPRFRRKPYFSPQFYEFDRLIAYYLELFGRDRVLVLPFELLVSDPASFVHSIQTFCGRAPTSVSAAAVVNERRPVMMQYAQRVANTLFSRNELSPGGLLNIPRLQKRFELLRPLFEAISPRPVESRLRRRQRAIIQQHVKGHFAASNRRTSELIDIALDKFGYEVGTASRAEAPVKAVTATTPAVARST